MNVKQGLIDKARAMNHATEDYMIEGNIGKSLDARKEFFQALDEALPTWIDWGDIDTDESPVPEGTIVEVQTRSGRLSCGYSENVYWDDNGPGTVIRYRILGSRGDS